MEEYEYEAILERFFERGKRLYRLGRYKEAFVYFREILEVRPKRLKVWIWKGKTLMHLGKNIEALKCANCALLLDKCCIGAWILKANVLRMLKQYNQESECYKKIKEFKPSFKPETN